MSTDRKVQLFAENLSPYDPEGQRLVIAGAKFAYDNPKVIPKPQDLSTCQKYLSFAIEELEYFIMCVENGTIKSTKTYNRFKKSVKKIKDFTL